MIKYFCDRCDKNCDARRFLVEISHELENDPDGRTGEQIDDSWHLCGHCTAALTGFVMDGKPRNERPVPDFAHST